MDSPLERMMDGDAAAASFLGAWILAREGRLTQLDLLSATLAYQPSRTRTKRNKPRERRRRLNGSQKE